MLTIITSISVTRYLFLNLNFIFRTSNVVADSRNFQQKIQCHRSNLFLKIRLQEMLVLSIV